MIRSRVGICLDDNAEYLDLSKSGIVAVGNLNGCQNIQILNLSQNCLQDVMNIGMYTNLWKLDLSYNQVKSLTGLVNFIVLGALNLAHNQLTWSELLKLRHIHILDLTLHGNPHLVQDTYYQIHAIDCLPNCWMLDGKMVSSGDQTRVKQFFKEVDKQKQPVRHKLPKYNYFPSYVKKVKDRGTFGPRAVHVLTTFPLNKPANIEIDKKRLNYLAFNMQEIIALEDHKCDLIKNHSHFLKELLELRIQNREQSNVLFLMLLASLEFCIPSRTIVEMLSVTKLHKCGDIFTIDLFLMPRELRVTTVGLLFNAIKLDREENVHAGVYEQLFLHLSSNLPELLKFSVSKTCKNYELPKSQCYKDYRFLLAAEICQVLMLVPSFYHYLQLQDPGLFCVLIEATNHKDIPEIINCIMGYQANDQLKNFDDVPEEGQKEGGTFLTEADTWQRDLSEMLTGLIQKHLKEVTTQEPALEPCEQILSLKPVKGRGRILWKPSESQMTGQIIGDLSLQPLSSKHVPRINETVILGKQIFGKIISLPAQNTAKVYIDGVLEPDGTVIKRASQCWKHYKTINLNNMDWDVGEKCWRWKMTKDYKEAFFLEGVSPLKVKKQDVKGLWTTPVRYCMSATSSGSRSITYVTKPDVKEKSFYLHCSNTDQEQANDREISRTPNSPREFSLDQPDLKVIMNMDNALDSLTKNDGNSSRSEFENYVIDLKLSSTKREHPDSELLVLHLEQSKRPHSVIPSLNVCNMHTGRTTTQEYFKKKYPLLADKKNMFLKLLTQSPYPKAIHEGFSADIPVLAMNSCLSGGDASTRGKTSEINETKTMDTIHSMRRRVKEKEQDGEGPKSNESCTVRMMCGQNWLAGGRNLFEESKHCQSLKRYNHLPGWKHGMNVGQMPMKSLAIKEKCPSTAFRITRPKSSATVLKKQEASFSRSRTIDTVRIQEDINYVLRDRKITSKHNRPSSAKICFHQQKEDKDSHDEEYDRNNSNFHRLSCTNGRVRNRSDSPYQINHPNTPIISPCNFLRTLNNN